MANLTEQNQYEDGIYQIEKSDPVVGGADGISNRQANQLANRTRWLKTRLDGLLDGSRIATLAARLATWRKINGVAFDGSSDITVQDATKLPLAGGQMEGPLRGKVGDTNTGGFVFDADTGLFSNAEDRLKLVAGGKVLLEGSLKGPLQAYCGLRVPKGAPAALDASYQSGYTFGADGDTGLFAEGGTENSSSNLVLRIDNIEVGRLALFTKLNSPNGFTRLISGQILQWAEFSVSHSAGQIVAWQVTLPTTFPTQCLQKFAVLGSGCTPSKVCLTVEGGSRNSLEGFLYSEIDGSRLIRVFAIGE
ncbi:hypothetical protein [Pseudomonas oryzihabitans]|uniref:hypothetical protein n=1 Tax=Pseudomonas oryzihabitans TaxID=47885 RepID=UPI00197F6790|nr:hypothetical protein [Pseudomonas psychrotolerans]